MTANLGKAFLLPPTEVRLPVHSGVDGSGWGGELETLRRPSQGPVEGLSTSLPPASQHDKQDTWLRVKRGTAAPLALCCATLGCGEKSL